MTDLRLFNSSTMTGVSYVNEKVADDELEEALDQNMYECFCAQISLLADEMRESGKATEDEDDIEIAKRVTLREYLKMLETWYGETED